MAKIQPHQLLAPSVLDALLDDDPDVKREPFKSRHQVLKDMKQSVRRDLENLLNTRRRLRNWPAELTELEKSLVSYGLPDLSGMKVTSAQGREGLGAVLENIIRTFEPRFKTVEVLLLENTETLDRTLRFRINALLYAEPAPEPVSFDSVVEPGSGSFRVRGGSD